MDNKLPKSRLEENKDDRDSHDSDFAEMDNQDESVNESVEDLKNTTRTAHYQQNVTAPLPKIALDIPESIFESDIKGPSEVLVSFNYVFASERIIFFNYDIVFINRYHFEFHMN